MNTFHYFDNVYPSSSSPKAPKKKIEHDMVRFMVRDVAEVIQDNKAAEDAFETIMFEYEKMKSDLIALQAYKHKAGELISQLKNI